MTKINANSFIEKFSKEEFLFLESWNELQNDLDFNLDLLRVKIDEAAMENKEKDIIQLYEENTHSVLKETSQLKDEKTKKYNFNFFDGNSSGFMDDLFAKEPVHHLNYIGGVA